MAEVSAGWQAGWVAAVSGWMLCVAGCFALLAVERSWLLCACGCWTVLAV
jgi:hypothetical protein